MTVNTVEAYFLVLMWPAVIGMITMVYAGWSTKLWSLMIVVIFNQSVLTFHQASIHRQKLKAMLQSSPNITTGHYCRLMAVCTVEIAFTTPLGVYSIVLNTRSRVIPYISWETIHADFSHVGQFPTVVLQSIPMATLGIESSRWSYVICAFIFFMFFGCGREAREGYGHGFRTLSCHVGLRSIRLVSGNTSGRSVPFYFHQVSSN